MVDRVSASITRGGTLSSQDFAHLLKLIADEDLSPEWDGEAFDPADRAPGQSLTLHAHEVAWGRFDALKRWCIGKQVPFARWSGAFSGECGGGRVVFERGTEPEYYAADEVDEVFITRRMVERLGSIEAILAYFDAADVTIPPLVVAGDDTGVSGVDQS
ncbi:hypothetical protein [Novosphingobium olei]|uniref:Uncharacterized protein n=1 Tax=Novosphingobium olei TaxID=2728851 RepID=A0A7Y0BT78_9SPHN|nr:hypothetical protein [Novosphingobium olei]NML96122.1 hypothetical protein [Novosphingobium olei]